MVTGLLSASKPIVHSKWQMTMPCRNALRALLACPEGSKHFLPKAIFCSHWGCNFPARRRAIEASSLAIFSNLDEAMKYTKASAVKMHIAEAPMALLGCENSSFNSCRKLSCAQKIWLQGYYRYAETFVHGKWHMANDNALSARGAFSAEGNFQQLLKLLFSGEEKGY